jgi:methylated-DNA-[protein]-cysteine S-methyltransferase
VNQPAGRDLATGIVVTPWGPWGVVASDRGIVRVALAGLPPDEDEAQAPPAAMAHLAEAQKQLCAYLAGDRRQFDLPLDAPPSTAFQRLVWDACARVPYGTTASYADLARAVRSPRAARAVGQALGANPLPILIPCHRILASDGSLGGYGGGLAMKRGLLALEGISLEGS